MRSREQQSGPCNIILTNNTWALYVEGSHHEHVEPCVVEDEAEAVVRCVDDPSLAGVEQPVLQENSGCSRARDAVHGEDVAIRCRNVVRFNGVAFV